MLKKINLFLMLLFASLAIFTPMYIFQKMIIMLGVFVFWFITSMFIDGNWIKNNRVFVSAMLLMMLLDYIISIVNYDNEAMLDGINKMPIYCWIFFYLFYSKNVYMPKTTVISIIAMFVISCYFTIIGNIEIPGASRLLAGAIDYYANDRATIRNMNIGGYDFIYALAFLTLPFLLWSKNNTKRSIICYVVFTIFAITVVLGAYMIGILIMAALFALSFIDLSKIQPARIIIILAICFLLKDFFLDLLGDVGDQYGISALSRHAEELESGSYGQGDKYNNRLFIYLGAIQNWLQSPVFGYLLGKPADLARSGHSELLGYLEKYGIFSVVYFAYFKKYYQRIKNSFITIQAQKAFTLLFAVFIVFGFIDRFDHFCGIGFMQFFFAPFLLLLMDKEVSNNERL